MKVRMLLPKVGAGETAAVVLLMPKITLQGALL